MTFTATARWLRKAQSAQQITRDTITIEPATGADEPAVRACAEEAYARYIPVIGRTPPPLLADYGAQIAAGILHVAKDRTSSVLGFVVYRPQENHMLLENVAVLSRAARRGIGKRLIARCEAAAQATGIGSVRLYTHEKMTENQAIYAYLGYHEIARAREDGVSRVFFEKIL